MSFTEANAIEQMILDAIARYGGPPPLFVCEKPALVGVVRSAATQFSLKSRISRRRRRSAGVAWLGDFHKVC